MADRASYGRDSPTIDYADPDAAVTAANYRSADVEELIGQFTRRAARLITTMTTLPAAAMSSAVVLDGREVGVELIVRSSWHECHHHLGDIRRIGQLDT